MKKMLRQSRKYVNYGEIPTKEYKCDTEYPAVEPLLSAENASDFENEVIESQARSRLPVKTRLMQQFRQNRAGKQQPSETSPGWKNRRKSRRNMNFDSYR